MKNPAEIIAAFSIAVIVDNHFALEGPVDGGGAPDHRGYSDQSDDPNETGRLDSKEWRQEVKPRCQGKLQA